MIVKCTGCEQGINIPDDKMPRGKAFFISCPGCRAKVRVEPPEPEPEETLDISVESQPEAEPATPQVVEEAPGLILTSEFDDDEEELVIYDENDQLALILDDKNRAAWADALEERGFKMQTAKSPDHAVHKMKFTMYHVVVLHENFGNVPFQSSPVYKILVQMEMSMRRNIFFVLIGSQFKTLNNMEAYAHSVNVVINEKDLDKLPQIIKKSFLEYEALYKVFKESLHAMGKA